MFIWTSLLKAKPHHTITHHQEKNDKDMHENKNKNKDGMYKYRATSFVSKKRKKAYRQITLAKMTDKNTKIIIEQWRDV